MPLPKLALPALAGLSLFVAGAAGGYLTAPSEKIAVTVADGDAKPAMGDLGTLIVPIWQHGKVVAFLATELRLELAPGNSPDTILPPVRDRLLSSLYEQGAKGQLAPSGIQPARFKADLLRLAQEVAGPKVTGVELVRLVHQENRRA
ncbi:MULTISPECIES: hypothetical protein [unclassified Azospirillum]|uniref:hypothetical protein n=1 Tax=unclassified Azospirillum TaxID=2630922 RepID=UPI000B6CEB2F|nr:MULTISPECIES: hypothetical protein [unclassified Azospirillum]SNS45627.1 hypothetical protein SAMN05880556_10560 [Azospirillum sp. RU38E]SNS64678.1 hypothetical protein SAMN05880591_10560 [Azospirillum sp. RU37A]